MAAITPQMVKELRDKTDAGMGECKKALIEANGDIDAAVDILRKAGIAKSAHRADRATAEGKIFVAAINDALGLYKVKVAEDKAKADAERAEKKGADDKAKTDERPARRPSRRPAAPRKDAASADGEKKAAPRRKAPAKEVKDLSELKKSDVKPEEK